MNKINRHLTTAIDKMLELCVRFNVTSSLVGWAHTQNEQWCEFFWWCVVRDKQLEWDYILRYMRHDPSAVKISLALRTPIWHHASLGSGDLHYTHWSYMLEKIPKSLYLKEHRQHDEIGPDILYQLVEGNCFIAIENLRTYTQMVYNEIRKTLFICVWINLTPTPWFCKIAVCA